MSLNHFRAIIFDFGGVLLDWNPRYLYRQFFPDNPQAMERFLAEIDFTGWNSHQDAGRPYSEAIADLCARFPHYCDLIRAYDERYLETISGPIWPSVEILKELRQAGYPLYALSNFPQEKYRLVRSQYDFLGWFADILISGEVKMAKPGEDIFRLLLERIGAPARQCLLIDDSPGNLETAARLGFQTILFRSAEALRADLTELGILTA